MSLFDMELSDLSDAQPAPPSPQNVGLLHYKFMPRTGEWSAADFAGALLSPSHPADITITARNTGKGQLRFHRSRWEDLPTLYHIVNTLAGIEEFRGAHLTLSEGSTDHADQRTVGHASRWESAADTATLLPAK